jgi:hypothetical protein
LTPSTDGEEPYHHMALWNHAAGSSKAVGGISDLNGSDSLRPSCQLMVHQCESIQGEKSGQVQIGRQTFSIMANGVVLASFGGC